MAEHTITIEFADSIWAALSEHFDRAEMRVEQLIGDFGAGKFNELVRTHGGELGASDEAEAFPFEGGRVIVSFDIDYT